jgi:TRAP-type uncharacterized transport system substrate-binding protein
MKKALRTILPLIAAAALFSCANPSKEAKPKPTTVPAKGEYVDYTPIGSWISKKVKKSRLKPTEQQVEQTQDAMRELQRPIAPGEAKN